MNELVQVELTGQWPPPSLWARSHQDPYIPGIWA